jgi:hypothetical protein
MTKFTICLSSVTKSENGSGFGFERVVEDDRGPGVYSTYWIGSKLANFNDVC